MAPSLRTARPLADRLYGRANRSAAESDAAGADRLYRGALAERPDFAEAFNNHGNALRALGRLDAAVAAYARAVRLGFGHALVHYNLAGALKEADRRDEAARAFRRALALRPDYAEAHNNHANLLRMGGNHAAAVQGYRRALATRPGWDEAHDNLAGALYLLHEAGGAAATAALAALWRRDHPDHPVARHIGGALAGSTPDPRAPDAYVRQIFDHFADEFEETLAGLGYRAPALLSAALERAGPPPDGTMVVLDAGCGTGLCAPFLRPYARTLVGVDLSPGMLERARARGLYDRLEEAELGAFLAAHSGAFDRIAAADVLCYFGDLGPVLAAAAAALAPDGLVAFTVERLAGEDAAHRVQPHGRYAHGETYLRRALAGAGLVPTVLEGGVLRQESGEPVAGLVVVAGRTPVR